MYVIKDDFNLYWAGIYAIINKYQWDSDNLIIVREV